MQAGRRDARGRAAPMGGDFLEIVLNEAPLCKAMWTFSVNILLLSLAISGITAMLVFFALHYLLVRPMWRITDNMIAFRADPENPSRIIAEVGPQRRNRHRRRRAGRHAARARLDAASAEPAGRARPRGVEDQSRPAQSAGLGATFLRSAFDLARSEGAALRAEADARARTRDRVLPVDALLWCARRRRRPSARPSKSSR